MIRKVTLIDFLAHHHTELELSEGITALTGPNNSGKSSIVEALRCVATSPPAKNYIRHGAKEARVILELDDGRKVEWIRKKAYPLYNIYPADGGEPETYAKFGRNVPDEVRDVMRLDHVALESGADIDVHIGNQRQPIFLIDQPGSVAANFFAASSESAYLLSMQKLLKKKEKEAKRKEKDHLERMQKAEGRLDNASGLPSLALDVAELRVAKENIDERETVLPALSESVTTIKSLHKETNSISTELAELKKTLSPPESLWPTDELSAHNTKEARLKNEKETAAQECDALKNILEPPVLFETQPLGELTRSCIQTAAEIGNLTREGNALGALKECSEVYDVSSLDLFLARVNDIRREVKCASAFMGEYAHLKDVPVFHETHLLNSLQNDLSQAHDLRKSAESELSKLQGLMDIKLKEIQELLERVGDCPLCGNHMEMELFIEQSKAVDNA
ncbi:MAG: AAA family ATPase [Desulfovibrio sp.]